MNKEPVLKIIDFILKIILGSRSETAILPIFQLNVILTQSWKLTSCSSISYNLKDKLDSLHISNVCAARFALQSMLLCILG